MVNEAFIIRHGETDWNVEGRWQGHSDPTLNTRGQIQAQQLATYFQAQGVSLDVIYSSDLQRAAQTATPLRDALDVPLHYDARLREIQLGVFQGLTLAEIAENYPDAFAAWRSSDLSYAIPEGESRLMLRQRALAAWNDITSRSDLGRVALVTHGGTIRHLLEQLFPDLPADFKLHNTGLTTLARQNGAWHLVGLSETPHLAVTDV